MCNFISNKSDSVFPVYYRNEKPDYNLNFTEFPN